MSHLRVHPHADDLTAALAAELSHHRQADLTAAAGRLMTAYRSGVPASSPVIETDEAALAYAAYRMPATCAAVTAALTAALAPAGLDPRGQPESVGSAGLAGSAGVAGPAGRVAFVPRTLLDVGGGTGAALWAAATVFPSLTAATVLDQSGVALRLGRRLAARSAGELPRAATWNRAVLTPLTSLPPADLVTMAYVLAQLPDATAAALVEAAARNAALVAVVEPGTPAGHRRVLAARRRLLQHGLHLLAPCPHENECPLADGRDWCHFGARLERRGMHRRLKGGSLGYEDEKFAYVVAARAAAAEPTGRVVRRPLHRPGLVRLEVCTPAAGVEQTLVSRRQGATYRAARDAAWGDPWPPTP